MSKVNNKDTRTTPWRRSGAFIVNFGHVSHLALVFLLLTLNMYLPAGLFVQLTAELLVKLLLILLKPLLLKEKKFLYPVVMQQWKEVSIVE